MEKCEGKNKMRPIFFCMSVHTMFIALLVVGNAYIYIRVTHHISQQELENANLREMVNKLVLQRKADQEEAGITQYEVLKYKKPESRTKIFQENKGSDEKDEEEAENNKNKVDLQPLISRIQRSAKQNCGNGSRGRKGVKGETKNIPPNLMKLPILAPYKTVNASVCFPASNSTDCSYHSIKLRCRNGTSSAKFLTSWDFVNGTYVQNVHQSYLENVNGFKGVYLNGNKSSICFEMYGLSIQIAYKILEVHQLCGSAPHMHEKETKHFFRFDEEKGSPGRKGDKGDKGDMGMTGRDGRDGRDGPQGIKGEKGETDKMYSTSAHFVGQGRARGATTRHCEGKSEQFFLFSWKKNHIRGSILYTNGELKVRQSGFYYIYAQIFYKDAIASLRGFKIFIDDCPVMQALNSPVSVSKKYGTHYTGGAFRILSDQRISVGTAFNQTFGYNAGQSFFGTFFIHP